MNFMKAYHELLTNCRPQDIQSGALCHDFHSEKISLLNKLDLSWTFSYIEEGKSLKEGSMKFVRGLLQIHKASYKCLLNLWSSWTCMKFLRTSCKFIMNFHELLRNCRPQVNEIGTLCHNLKLEMISLLNKSSISAEPLVISG